VSVPFFLRAFLYDRRVGSTTRGFRPYVPVAVLTIVIAIVGFWARYYSHVLSGTVTTAPIIQLHGAIFLGWLLLVTTQAVLAARGQLALHMKFGKAVMVYGVCVIAIGIVASFAVFGFRLAEGNALRARAQLFVGLTDMLTFAPFLAAAWIYRRRPEVHKRLIVVATAILLIAPAHRMHWFLGGPPAPLVPLLAIWLAPIWIGMIYDGVTRRILHPVYVLGILAIVYMKFWRMPLMYETETYNAFVEWVTRFYG
jgi:hypothetical protein